MWKGVRGLPVVLMVAWNLASCGPTARKAATPVPEEEQVVSAALKTLYMAASAEAPQSPAQQKIILRMADEASNGKELLLAMRAAVGAFPPGAGSMEASAERRMRSIVTSKMIDCGTLDQMVGYASQYPVAPESSRMFVQRMFELGGRSSDPRVWYRIRLTASRLKVADLEQQALARGDELAAR